MTEGWLRACGTPVALRGSSLAALAAGVALALTAAGCASPPGASLPPSSEAATPGGSEQTLPPGWRWESFGGVQIGVPGEWGWADTGVRLHAWCIGGPDRAKPVVARPVNATPAIACIGAGTSLEENGPVVGLEWTPEPDGVAHDRDRTTVRLAGVEVTVQAPGQLRRRIVATIHRVEVDSAGCPATHPVTDRPGFRPVQPAAVAALRDVTAVSACKYTLIATSPGGGLMSGLRLGGPDARQAVRRVAQAPVGGGPDDPALCPPEAPYGDDAIVLRITSAAGTTEVLLRYSGCDHNGFDDGVTVRRLTAAAVAPFVAGANRVMMHSGNAEKTPMLE